MPNEPLQGVLARLDTVIDKARKTRDRRGFFAALYRRVTREVADRIRNGRFDRPEDVARAVLFLCSAMSAHVTGQVLRVDGGQLMA